MNATETPRHDPRVQPKLAPSPERVARGLGPRPVIGVFVTRDAADQAASLSLGSGISVRQVSVISPRRVRLDVEGVEPVREVDPGPMRARSRCPVDRLLSRAAWMTIADEHGIGTILVAGPMFVALATGARAGGFARVLVRRGIRRELADHFADAVRAGHIVLGVEPRSREQARAVEDAFLRAGVEPLPLPVA